MQLLQINSLSAAVNPDDTTTADADGEVDLQANILVLKSKVEDLSREMMKLENVEKYEQLEAKLKLMQDDFAPRDVVHQLRLKVVQNIAPRDELHHL